MMCADSIASHLYVGCCRSGLFSRSWSLGPSLMQSQHLSFVNVTAKNWQAVGTIQRSNAAVCLQGKATSLSKEVDRL